MIYNEQVYCVSLSFGVALSRPGRCVGEAKSLADNKVIHLLWRQVELLSNLLRHATRIISTPDKFRRLDSERTP